MGGELSPWHLAIVAVAVVVLFGSAKLPDAARALGRSLRIFKAELRAGDDQPTGPAAVPAPDVAPPEPGVASGPVVPAGSAAPAGSASETRDLGA